MVLEIREIEKSLGNFKRKLSNNEKKIEKLLEEAL